MRRSFSGTMTANLPQLTAALADRYRIGRELGAGGMATVYLAHDVRHDRKVALKVLRPELSAILGAERFLAEIKTTANLQHPHILGLFDSGEAAGLVYYVMPFVEGESLRDRLSRDHQLPVDEAVRLAREVADALEYAHQHGIVHRDIKPENILLHGGHAVVADFGIALAASRSEGGTRMTETGMSLGTPHYMSPEQAMGEREITPKTDIYALGCVLYEMLTAEPPFTGASAQAIIGRVLTEEPRSLTAQRKTIPPNVEAAVQTALCKLPADRFNSAREFGEALARSDYTSGGTRATAAATAGRGVLQSRARRLAPWGVAALAASLALLTSLWPEPPSEVAWHSTVIWPRPSSPGSLGRTVAISPDGRTMVYVDTVGGRQLWVKERDRLEVSPLAGTAGALSPTFSPDGEWIAFVSERKLKRVPRLGGSSITIAEPANEELPAIAWLDDGTVLFNNPAYDLQAISINGGEQRRWHWVDSTQRGAVNASPLPDGRGALVITCSFGCPDARLAVIDARSGVSKDLVETVVQAWHLPNGFVVFVRQDGGVFGAPFDLDEMAFRSAPVPILDGVRTAATGADMTLSPSGTLLYVAGAGLIGGVNAEFISVNRAGVVSRIDSSWSFLPPANGSFSLSPDGRRLAVSISGGASSDIWIKELPAGPLTRLTFEGANLRPIWTPDSRSVIYASSRTGTNYDVHSRLANGTGGTRVMMDHARSVIEIRTTRDTSQLLVRLGAPPSRDVWIARLGADSVSSTPLLAESFEEVTPELSPDGRWLAYASNETGRHEVYVRPYPDVNAGRWQVSRNGGQMPRWAHSGRELFFVDAALGMVAASVSPETTFALGAQQTLFRVEGFLTGNTIRHWDLTADDRNFVFMRQFGAAGAASGTPVTVIQVDNWASTLNGTGARRP